MADKKTKGFWAAALMLLMGLAMLAGAFLVLSRPGTSLPAFTAILGAMALLRGAAYLFVYFRGREEKGLRRYASLALGLLLCILGLLLILLPGVLNRLLSWLVAAWFVFTALKDLLALPRVWKGDRGFFWVSFVLNLLLLLSGLGLLLRPFPEALSLPALLAVALFCEGLDLILSAIFAKGEERA